MVDGQVVEGLAYSSPYFASIVWLYCILWWFIQDAAKVGVYFIMEKYNILGINDSLMMIIPSDDDDEDRTDDDRARLLPVRPKVTYNTVWLYAFFIIYDIQFVNHDIQAYIDKIDETDNKDE